MRNFEGSGSIASGGTEGHGRHFAFPGDACGQSRRCDFRHLIPHATIRKISFTGSTAVGKRLAALAGAHMKRATMELGGHAPAIIFDDADLDRTVKVLAAAKFAAPARFASRPLASLCTRVSIDSSSTISRQPPTAWRRGRHGALAHRRRLDAMEAVTTDAVACGARVAIGGARIGSRGYFFAPTVLAGAPVTARAMNEESFGPIALIAVFRYYEGAIREANRLACGLAAFAWTQSAKTITNVSRDLEARMVSINHHGLVLPEVPFGVKDSGYGSEGGASAGGLSQSQARHPDDVGPASLSQRGA
jgi:succinate-semialdehyde dehydrogenase/glutarate-semialdehyde dehydrogenase